MFEDCAFGPIGFEGTGEDVRKTADGECQTSFSYTQEAEVQTKSFTDTMVQTDVIMPLKSNYDEKQLAEFLKNAYGIIENEISLPCPEFDMDYEDSDFFGKCTKLHAISEPPLGLDGLDMRATLLLWKTEKNLLYVGYSSEHGEWCNHFGFVRIYNFKEKTLEMSASAVNELIAPACLTCMDIHPIIPNALAGGTFTGEVIVWNTLKTENAVIATSVPYNNMGFGHTEAVSQLLWIRNIDINDKNPLLMTSGLDGTLILWQYSPITEELQIHARLLLKPDHKKGENNFFGLYDVQLRITCFSVSTYNPLTVVVGMDAGHLLSCSMTGVVENNGDQPAGKSRIDVKNPILGRYESHAASVTDIQHVKYDPKYPERFATCGLDRCVKLFNAKQEMPTNIFYCDDVVFGLFFWSLDPNKLVAWGCRLINIYDISKGEQLNSPSFTDELQNLNTTSVTTNGHLTVLVGKMNGVITAWRVQEPK